MNTPEPTHTVLRRIDQHQANAFGGILRANKPVIGGAGADGRPSAALFYWSHSNFTDDFEFGLHRHEGFEIVTFVLTGENSHFDTAGGSWVPLRDGDVQIIRSGSGISHNERVAKGTTAFQIWFDPGYHQALQRTPDYSDHRAATLTTTTDGGLDITSYVGDAGPIQSSVDGLLINRLRANTPITHQLELGTDRYSIIYVIAGPAAVDGHELDTDDAIIVRGSDRHTVTAPTGTDLFVVSVPMSPPYTPVRS